MATESHENLQRMISRFADDVINATDENLADYKKKHGH
jgi:hypothetical protein